VGDKAERANAGETRFRTFDSRLVPLVYHELYHELRRVAKGRLRSEAPGHVLQTTALVHEVYSLT
jgi:hypothetical protein